MVRIKWHLQPKQVENRVDLLHDSDRGDECYIESNKYHKHLWLELNDTYSLNNLKHLIMIVTEMIRESF